MNLIIFKAQNLRAEVIFDDCLHQSNRDIRSFLTMCTTPSSNSQPACCRRERSAPSFVAWCACRRLNIATHFLSQFRPRTAYGAMRKACTRREVSGTARRMEAFEKFAPQLAVCSLNKLRLTPDERDRVTHVIVTSCTGLYAPGLDYDIVNHLGLNPSVERTMIGFMGCYAAINALKSAHHIVRSVPEAVVLVLNLELCTLHLQETQNLEQMLSFLLFADGCAACLVSADPRGSGNR